MRTWLATVASTACRFAKSLCGPSHCCSTLSAATAAFAQPEGAEGGEASLKLPDLSSVGFLNGAIDGHKLLMIGILFCIFGLLFGMVIYMRLKNLPVHRAMREISELIYETCKTYLITQGKFLLLLGSLYRRNHRVLYFGVLAALRTSSRNHHPLVQLGRNRWQFRRGLVRYSCEHVCEFPHCVRFAAR